MLPDSFDVAHLVAFLELRAIRYRVRGTTPTHVAEDECASSEERLHILEQPACVGHYDDVRAVRRHAVPEPQPFFDLDKTLLYRHSLLLILILAGHSQSGNQHGWDLVEAAPAQGVASIGAPGEGRLFQAVERETGVEECIEEGVKWAVEVVLRHRLVHNTEATFGC